RTTWRRRSTSTSCATPHRTTPCRRSPRRSAQARSGKQKKRPPRTRGGRKSSKNIQKTLVLRHGGNGFFFQHRLRLRLRSQLGEHGGIEVEHAGDVRRRRGHAPADHLAEL